MPQETPSRTDRELGMLLGLHAGDSLGATLEFQAPVSESKWLREIVGGGPLRWNPGDATDDTDLMICVLSAIQKNRTEFSFETLIDGFLSWYDSDPVDIGNTTERGLERLIEGHPPEKCGSSGEYDQGNGSLMRCAPLALLNVGNEELERIIAKQARITHAHRACIRADVTLVYALRDLLSGLEKQVVFENAIARSPELSEAIETPWEEFETSGYVRHTLIAGFWALMNCDSFEESVVKIVNRGRDADTCGAVAGALCGAYYGVRGIPESWLGTLKRAGEIRGIYERG